MVFETLPQYRHLEITAFVGPSQKSCAIRACQKTESQHVELRIWAQFLCFGQSKQVYLSWEIYPVCITLTKC